MAPEYASCMGFIGTEEGGQRHPEENHEDVCTGLASGYAAFHADDVASREAGLLACGHLVDLMLRCDVKIANHAQQGD